jgi:hypothetical protein
MKKVVLSMALVAMMSVSFVSCKDAAAPAEGEAAVEAPVMEEAVEAAAETVDTAAAAATEAAAGAATEAAAGAAGAVEAAAGAVKEEVKK